jgi:hypothetical protein
MILDNPIILEDGSIFVIVRDENGNEIGSNQTFPVEEA